jgi:hypothetical protein
MAKSEAKKQRVEPEKPRKNPSEPLANTKGDGLAHDVTVRDVETLSDLERNPGIGASKGTTMAGADADDLDEEMSEAENTFKGDVENDAGRPGVGVDPKRTGRHNK